MFSHDGKSRKEREEEFRRQHVLESAEALFDEKGFDGTTVSDIAERSELAKGSLYNIFKSKQEIVDAIVERKVDEMRKTLNEIFAKNISPMDKLLQIMDAKLRGIWENRGFAKLFINEFHGFNWYLEIPILKSCGESIIEMLKQLELLIIDAQKAGEIRDDVHYKLVLASMGGISDAVIHLWLKEDSDIDIESVIEMAKELFVNGIHPQTGGSK
ncbi:MAG: TetR/AcrR family transcriptional regulator [bacterium]|nr:TetR/AcrR family transcriptional regulator [bacterium]